MASVNIAGLWHADICWENPAETAAAICELHQEVDHHLITLRNKETYHG
jgi:hypothetical protein